MRSFLGFILMLTMACSTAVARDIFVDNLAGDDRHGGQTSVAQGVEGGPCRTIGKALRIAQPGDRIVVANTGEPYRECLSVQAASHSGSDAFPFQIIGNGAVLDGTVSLVDAQWEHFRGDIHRTRPARMSYQQLFVAGAAAPRKTPEAGQPIELAPGEWALLEGWLYFCCEKDRLPGNYDLSCCLHPVGITLYEVHDVIIENFTIRGFYLDGVNCHDQVTRSDLINVRSEYNGRSGFSIGGASRVRVDTCSAAGNGAAQLRTEGYSITQLLDNQFDPASAPAIVREGGEVIDGP
jgi:hypothetical protein